MSRRKFLCKPSSLFSFRDKQSSGLNPAFQPNESEMKQAFNMIDADKDGKISQEDYKNMLKVLGKDDLIEGVPMIFRKVDLNRDGFIDFKDFMEWHKKGGWVKSMDLYVAFRTFDLNGDGKICAEDVQKVLKGLGEECSLEDCQRMVRAVDTDGDGEVRVYDFKTMMTRSM
ncbi:calmodulin-like protein 30 [Alnus glutinosa]|uniref:calmodulin-like protein 30 n=1 Tax=Alnus glutinosa TaxID=3517 RepID=UPI002D770442|nr:calmodulin-like protein 30 [Alnus glutinosa]